MENFSVVCELKAGLEIDKKIFCCWNYKIFFCSKNADISFNLP